MDALDIRGVPDKYIPWLKRLVEGVKNQAGGASKGGKNVVFATHDSDVIGGEFKRTNAYE